MTTETDLERPGRTVLLDQKLTHYESSLRAVQYVDTGHVYLAIGPTFSALRPSQIRPLRDALTRALANLKPGTFL